MEGQSLGAVSKLNEGGGRGPNTNLKPRRRKLHPEKHAELHDSSGGSECYPCANVTENTLK